MAYRRGHQPPQARTERWGRDDDAPRLSAEVPQLSELKINVEEWRGEQPVSGTRYTKRILVATAPARFEVPCGEPKCQDGGHDITMDLMRGLRNRATNIECRSECRGAVGDRSCERAVRFVAFATYSDVSK